MLILRHIWAVLAGLILIIVLSIGTDTVLEKTIWPGLAQAQASMAVWIFVTAYRAAYSIAGCWLAARLAPDHPMTHALALGFIGVLFSSLGAIVMWGVGPNWYPIALIVISLPCAWIGGRLAQRRRKMFS
jgi:hypothetical protein